MFTGIVEERAEVHRLEPRGDGVRLEVRARFVAEPGAIALGDSVAVNGCCLTVVTIDEGRLGFDLLEITRSLTNLRELRTGGVVNLERSLRFDGRVGGHFVSGHVDAAAPILALEPRGADVRLEVAIPERFRHLLIPKGSIAIDGISLTVAELLPESVVAWLIPHTLAVTNLGTRVAGELVNLEFDLLAKYVERMLAARTPS